MFDSICALPLSSDLFAQAIHPTEPLVAIGLASGHVATLRLPAGEEEHVQVRLSGQGGNGRRLSDVSTQSTGTGTVDTVWRTRRHKGSCRALCYSCDGTLLFSAGTDGVVKVADSHSGKVVGKVAIPLDQNTGEIDAPSVMYALSPQTLLLGTDCGALHLYDLRDPASSVSDTKPLFVSPKPATTTYPHTSEPPTSITPLPPSGTSTSGVSKQWLSTGGSTLTLTDLRRGVLVKSEDQEEILLSSLLVSGLAHKKKTGSEGEKILVGGGDGVLTLWEKGYWEDQQQRITVSREGETLDCLARIPDGIGGPGIKVAVGTGDGVIRIVHLGPNKVVGEMRHDELEGVVGLGFDVSGRMISSGGQVLKIWQEVVEQNVEEEDDNEEITVAGKAGEKRAADSDDEDVDGDEAESSEEELPKRKRKKRKKGKGQKAVAATGMSFTGLA